MDSILTPACDAKLPLYDRFSQKVRRFKSTLLTSRQPFDDGLHKLEFRCDSGHNYSITKSTFDGACNKVLKNVRIEVCPVCVKAVKVRTPNKNWTFQMLKEFFEAPNTYGKSCVLIDTEYLGSHYSYEYICECGERATITIGDFKQGKRCMKCKAVKYKKTCQERYGVDNVFQIETIKEVSKATTVTNHGVEYCMQNKEIKQRSEETCLQKYGYKHRFVEPEVFERIRATHMENHGVEYPFQSPEIHNKAMASSWATKDHITKNQKRSDKERPRV